MNELSRESKALLVAARRLERTSPEDRVRIRGKLAHRLATGLAVGTAVTAGATAAEAAHAGAWATAVAWLPSAAKVISIVAVAGAVGAGAAHVVHERANAKSLPVLSARSHFEASAATTLRKAQASEAVVGAVAQPSAVVQTEPPTVERPRSHGVVESPRVRAVQPAVPADNDVSPNPIQHDSLGSQVAAIREARAAIRAGQAEQALKVLDAQFAAGHASSLLPEATMARIAALCAQGNVGSARQVADEFLSKFPGSTLASRMRGSCAYAGAEEP